MEIVNIAEAKAHLSALVKKALAGEEVIISRSNEPLVRLTPIVRDTSPRVGGFLKGQIIYEEDSAATDKEIEESFYASPIFPEEKK